MMTDIERRILAAFRRMYRRRQRPRRLYLIAADLNELRRVAPDRTDVDGVPILKSASSSVGNSRLYSTRGYAVCVPRPGCERRRYQLSRDS